MADLTPREKVALKSCPFCGGHHLKCLKVFSEDEPGHQIGWQVFCEVCHAHGPASVRIGWCETEADAQDAWNRRTALASGSGDHAELARLAEAASGSEWQTYISGRPEYKNVTHYVEQNPPRDLPFIAEVQEERDAAFIAAANPATVLALLAEVAALRSKAALTDLLGEKLERRTFALDEAERKLAEAVGLLETLSLMFHPYSAHGRHVRTFLSKEAERGLPLPPAPGAEDE